MVLDRSMDYIPHDKPRRIIFKRIHDKNMQAPICVHGVHMAHWVRNDHAQAVGIRGSDSTPVLFDVFPEPTHKSHLKTPPGFITKQVLPVPDMNPADTESMWFLILGEFPNAYVANTNEHEDILLIDDRHHTDPASDWPNVWKVTDNGCIVDIHGQRCGKITCSSGSFSLVIQDATECVCVATVTTDATDSAQLHPWDRTRPQSIPQRLVKDGEPVDLPGGPYTLIHDGGFRNEVRLVSVDELSTLVIPNDRSDKLSRRVYIDDLITTGHAYAQPSNKPVTICLTMIIKNEGKTIRRALENARNLADTFCICDTGSSDNTTDEVRKFLKETNTRGRVFSHPFRDFGYNRTVSWAAGRGLATYQLFLDADHVVQARSDFDKDKLEADSYIVNQNTNGCTYWNLRLARDDGIDGCIGVTHEYWNATGTPERLELVRIIDVGDGGAKKDKFERDQRLLERQLAHTPNDARTWFYLANTFRDRKNYEKAIEAYKKRVELQGWAEEVWCSQLNIGRCCFALGRHQEGAVALLDAHQTDPARVENLVDLANHYRETKRPILAARMCALGLMAISSRAQNPRLLFVEEHNYAWRCNYELSLVRQGLGTHGAYLDNTIHNGIFILLGRSPLPVDHLIQNHLMYVGQIPVTNDALSTMIASPHTLPRSNVAWCVAGANITSSKETPFVFAGWQAPVQNKVVITWSAPGENQSTAATADTVESPCVMNSASSSWILTSGKSDSMLLHAWVQERRMSPVRRYPPNIPHDCCFKRGQQLMTVTRWVPFKYTQVSAQHEAPKPAALPWRGVSVIGSMDAGSDGIWFLLRIGDQTPAVYSILRSGERGQTLHLAWTFSIKDHQGQPCGFWINNKIVTIATRENYKVQIHPIPLDHLRWSDAAHCV